MEKQPKECAPESMDSEDSLFVMFTSGVTGSPKGIVHSQAGYLLHVAVTHKVYYSSLSQKHKIHHYNLSSTMHAVLL